MFNTESSFYTVTLSGFANDETLKLERISGFETMLPPTKFQIKGGNIGISYSNAVAGMKWGMKVGSIFFLVKMVKRLS